MPYDVSELENIFRMMQPVDLLGVQKLTTSKITENYVLQLFQMFFRPGGALSVDNLTKGLATFLESAPQEGKDDIAKIIRIFASTEGIKQLDNKLGTAHALATAKSGTGTVTATFDDIVGTKLEKKKMAIALINSGYLSPAMRNAERVEMFLNCMPSIILSRMVPLLDVEFTFRSEDSVSDVKGTHGPGMLRFLLGSDATASRGATTLMSDARKTLVSKRVLGETAVIDTETTMGMEMFTSPQTLVNPSPVSRKGRYVDVIDPFRPFASIESFTVNVTPTVGMFSYEKATLVIKLHDRSRLAEISDLLRPQIYQQASLAPTVWVTYGWRHPPEPGNPYAEFINSTMLVRKAYHVINTQFSFDQVGQVTITIALWTKGAVELKTLRTTHNAELRALEEIRKISRDVQRLATDLGIFSEGVNREIRGYQLIESAARGSFPDLTVDKVKETLDALQKSLDKREVNSAAAKDLLEQLKKLYEGNQKAKNFEFKEKIKQQAADAARMNFNLAMTGVDPFLPIPEKNPDHPYVNMVTAYNDAKDIVAEIAKGYTKKLVSLGKLMSVFLGSSVDSISSIDEMQLFFYQFNDRAGAAANTNIAEFPIDMPVFLDQYREHVERKGTDGLTLDEFFRLLIDAQISDTRAVAYGYRSYFAPYDPKAKHDAKLAKDKEQAYESALMGLDGRGPFQKPVLEFYVETTHAAKSTLDQVPNSYDLLKQFEQQATDGELRDYTRIMRVHVFDKTNNPHKLATTILRGDDERSFVEIKGGPDNFKDIAKKSLDELKTALGESVTESNVRLDAGFSNQDIKNVVSRTMPSIIYGSNASMVTNANLASKHDPLMVTTQMQSVLRSGKGGAIEPGGSGPGGLPLRVIPASMTMTTLGCPVLEFGQLFFVDFNTGTTIDNIYNLTGITHTLTPGRFESQLTLTFADAYGRFEGSRTLIQYAESLESKFKELDDNSKNKTG